MKYSNRFLAWHLNEQYRHFSHYGIRNSLARDEEENDIFKNTQQGTDVVEIS